MIKILVASRKTLLWTIFIIFLGVFLTWRSHNQNIQLISPFLKPDLKKVIENSLYQAKGKYGIYVKNLKTGETFSYKGDETFTPGSLYKLKLMVLVFEKIKEGSLEEDKILTANVKDLNNSFEIPEEDAELKEGIIEFTVKSALEQMVTISHNYAALILTKELKVEDLAKPTSAKEWGEFFEKLYKGEIISKEYSDKMLELLKKQQINDRIPKLLPREVVIAHKTADIGKFEHDAGIIYSPAGDYIFVGLSEYDIPDTAGARIAEISKAVYDYFTK